jgi:hypothetical protein
MLQKLLLMLICLLLAGVVGQAQSPSGSTSRPAVQKQTKDQVIAAKREEKAEKAEAASGVELVSDGGNPALRFPVAHIHGGLIPAACYGYLDVSRESVRYEVVGPEKNKDHAFEHSRADILKAGDMFFRFLPLHRNQAKIRMRSGAALRISIRKGKNHRN